VALGLQRSGVIITNAAIIVIVVSACFATADMILVKALGLGMALAVALDATLVRGLLVPATMRLLGNLNWWLPFAGVQGRPTPGAINLVPTPLPSSPAKMESHKSMSDTEIGGSAR
jgi:RND superfamily putative drug exporter